MIYRTAAPMPPKEKVMRHITKDEKQEKTSSIESFRAVQVISFIAACCLLGGTVLSAMQMPDQTDTAKSVERKHSEAVSIALAVAALGGFILSWGATRRISKLQPFVESYWEQCSQRATSKDH